MTRIEDIEKAVSQLAPREYNIFRDWFEQFETLRFDRQIEQDAKAGKLDRLAGAALNDYREGRFTEL